MRRIRRIMTALGFTTRQITNAYRVHEPAGGHGRVASTLFAIGHLAQQRWLQ
jgi:hypothetical protein